MHHMRRDCHQVVEAQDGALRSEAQLADIAAPDEQLSLLIALSNVLAL